ncbi:hypothetical protein [Vallitalea maricola]|uniref:Uncharacterized protein n=1 Tax=Vallitalea maricola TaxID=3074433 RepID=A0ACB5UGK2_9FIRM|nr:hypothetical protein AN2V17_09080 [Vallitalea sp. AN17-2]
MKKNILVLGILLLLLLFFETQSKNTIEDAMEKANINVRQILHQVDSDKGVVVFYEPMEFINGCNVGLVEKHFNKYKWVFGGGTSCFLDEVGLTWNYCNVGKSCEKGSKDSFPVVYGAITHSDIVEVTVALKGDEANSATIVETALGRIWYLFLDKQIGYTPEILGLDSNGELIFGMGM